MAVFFADWPRWAQLSFVLAVAIVIVFAIGVVKLWWMTRFVARQEIIDEEKRTRIQRLRDSGIQIESRKGKDIPFGIRALESGIEIDGIWVSSNSATSVPASLKEARNDLSEESSSVAQKEYPRLTGSELARRLEAYKDEIEESSYGRSVIPEINEQDSMPSSLHPGKGPQRPAYKPRRASQLRFSTHGGLGGEAQVHEDTLYHLEGRHSKLQSNKLRKTDARVSRVPSGHQSDALIDNERSSNTSEASYHALSNFQTPPMKMDTFQNVELDNPGATTSYSNQREPGSKPWSNVSYSDYDSTTYTSSSSIKHNPLMTPQMSFNQDSSPLMTPAESSPDLHPQHENSTPMPALIGHLAEDYDTKYTVPNPSRKVRGPPTRHPVTTGALHINKSVRKVNSAFQVLPAGTFGTPPEFLPSSGSTNDADEAKGKDKVKPRRLSKVNRASTSRPPT